MEKREKCLVFYHVVGEIRLDFECLSLYNIIYKQIWQWEFLKQSNRNSVHLLFSNMSEIQENYYSFPFQTGTIWGTTSFKISKGSKWKQSSGENGILFH